LFAILQTDRVYGWGRNDKGQLGLGSLYSPQKRPQLVQSLANFTINNIFCGSDYSCVLMNNQTLMVCGSLEHGKLGLSVNHRSGLQQTFAPVPGLEAVKSVSCGINHMAVICEKNKYFSWGLNDRGQLGVGNKNNQFVP
jgi:alpha-tubulin suppressor-like RCC1 family protein